MGSLHKNIKLMLEFLKVSFYVNDLPDDVTCNIVVYGDAAALYSGMIRHLICGNN